MKLLTRKIPELQEGILRFLYNTVPGRLLLKPLVSPAVSKLCGAFLSSGCSACLIQPFIKSANIDISQFERKQYKSYNEFFSRKIRPEARPMDREASHLISPCDSRLTVLPITPDSQFTLKHTPYTLTALLRSRKLAEQYSGGVALIFRLTVEDYHRYCYVSDGYKSRNFRIPGVLHTVNPIANDMYPIYKENAREYSILRTREFHNILMMEVGALLVGKIVNYHEKAQVYRGQEKGYFQFGGSTIVLLLQKDTVQIYPEILLNSAAGIETPVKYGEAVGESCRIV